MIATTTQMIATIVVPYWQEYWRYAIIVSALVAVALVFRRQSSEKDTLPARYTMRVLWLVVPLLIYAGGRLYEERIEPQIRTMRIIEDLHRSRSARFGGEWDTLSMHGRLGALEGCTWLEELHLAGSGLIDSDLEEMPSLPSVRTLDLQNNRISDRGIEALAGFQLLEELNLSSTAIECPCGINDFRELRSLTVTNTSIDDEFVVRCSLVLPQLRTLTMSYTLVTDRSLSEVSRIESLQSLSLQATRVNGSGLAYFNGHPSLHTIDLRETLFDDPAVEHLHHIPHLKTVRLGATRVTEKRIASLRRDIPHLRVED